MWLFLVWWLSSTISFSKHSSPFLSFPHKRNQKTVFKIDFDFEHDYSFTFQLNTTRRSHRTAIFAISFTFSPKTEIKTLSEMGKKPSFAYLNKRFEKRSVFFFFVCCSFRRNFFFVFVRRLIILFGEWFHFRFLKSFVPQQRQQQQSLIRRKRPEKTFSVSFWSFSFILVDRHPSSHHSSVFDVRTQFNIDVAFYEAVFVSLLFFKEKTTNAIYSKR